MKQMLSADDMELLSWIIERDADANYLSMSQFVQPGLVDNFTEAGRLEAQLGYPAYEIEHVDADALQSKAFV